MTKAPKPTNKSNKQRDNTKHATKLFDYTMISDQLRTVSWSNSSHPTGVVKPVYEHSTFPLITTAVYSKGHTFNKHSESIAKAIQVPYRPQQIWKRHNCYKKKTDKRGPKQDRSTEGCSKPKSRTRSVLCRYKFIWIIHKTTKKVLKTQFKRKAITEVKVCRKLELDLYNVNCEDNKSTKFKVNISKDCRKK